MNWIKSLSLFHILVPLVFLFLVSLQSLCKNMNLVESNNMKTKKKISSNYKLIPIEKNSNPQKVLFDRTYNDTRSKSTDTDYPGSVIKNILSEEEREKVNSNCKAKYL